MNVGPLVSIIVITYNSSKFILETLNSIKAQTYKNLELIISDDCSTDVTALLCQSWLDNHKDRFINVQLIIASKNTGIAANCNRGYACAKGEWVKGIAGDDILLPNCIEKNISFVAVNRQALVVFSMLRGFKGDKLLHILPTEQEKALFYKSTEEQLKAIILANFVTAPTLFINREVLSNNGWFDEDFPFLEDYPLWVKLLNRDIHLYFLDSITVYYRQEESITRTENNFISVRFFESYKSFMQIHLFPLYKQYGFWQHLYSQRLYLLKMKLALHFFQNRVNFFSLLIMKLFSLIDPQYYMKIYRKYVIRKL